MQARAYGLPDPTWLAFPAAALVEAVWI